MHYDPEQITFFAKTDARGQNVPFGIKAKDRTRHMYVIGKTGMGKSTLLENMAVQDMQNGNGLAFIDPHGATAETLLEYVPEERVDDVLYFAPFDTENPIAFNVMEDVGPEKRHLVAAGLMSVFKKIWVDAWSARMEYILQNTLLALLEYPDSTLLGVNRMLSEKHYRKKVIDNISDPAVKAFWVDEFLNYNERYMQEAGDSIKNKIGQFTANPLIRNIIGQPHTSFDLRQIMDEQKIVIVNLSKGLIGESNANLLGSMMTTRIYLAAMSRADLPPQQMKQMPNFYFYVDEFQSFANATFADILSEARKYHLNLTIAHQYVEQMEEEVKNAVFGNVGTIISFRVGPFDAEVLETIFAPQFYAVDICNLGFAQIYLSLMIDGIGSKPFSATTLPPIETPERSCRDMVIARSKANFGSDRTKIEADINDWMSEDFAPPKPPRTNGHKPNGNGKPGGKPGNGKPPAPKTPDVHALRDVLKDMSAAAPETPKTPSPKPAKAVTKKSAPKADAPVTEATAPAAEAIPTPKKPTKPIVKPAKEKVATPVDTSSSDLEALRNVLKDLAEATPNDAAKMPQKVGAPKKKPTLKTSDKTESQDESSGAINLRTALAEVLADREAKQSAKKNTKTSTHKKPSTTTVAQTEKPPRGDAEVVKDEPYRATKSKDPLDPKKLERMLKVTGADNSPLRKR